jgi:hypothetical protein
MQAQCITQEVLQELGVGQVTSVTYSGNVEWFP